VAVAGSPRVRKVVMTTPVVRDVAWRFVAGEDLTAGLAVARAMNGRGIKCTLSFVGTHVRDVGEVVAATDTAIEALRGIAAADVDANVSVKLTQIGLDIDAKLCTTELRRLLDVAAEVGNFVRIDMEESAYVEGTLDLFEVMLALYGTERVGIVVQSYLRDRTSDLDRLMNAGARIRLVKGGYWEPAGIVYGGGAEIDRAFMADIERLLGRGRYPAIATHDERAIDHACRIATSIGLDRHGFEFQMLYGVRPDLQHRLTRDGYVVRSYVPFGGQWYAYVLGCLRRLPGGMLKATRRRIGRLRA
jgi:proline dehydrogenase